jgi:NAD(P)-dependent dehydrogenase (short-subunit alcohol dehydrogenase family)
VKTGLVIGAAGGIGAACVRALTGSADVIVLAGRRREPLEAVATDAGGSTVTVSADVATAEGRQTIVGAVEGAVAWVVLASGIAVRKPLAELAEEEIESAFAANLVGPALLLRRLLDLPWQEPKAVAVIGSISASRSLPHRAAYAASKAGLEHLARSLAAELAPAGIRVNIVSPGVIETPFLGDARAGLADWVRVRVPLARLGTPDEVANAVRYVVLDAPAYLTGARIAVDGGAEALA